MIDPELRGSAAHVFVADLDAPELDRDDEHHLARVLRLTDGQSVSASDGGGRWRMTRWAGGRLEPDGEIREVAAGEPEITIGFVPVKGDRPEWTVQKLTEVGADRIVVLRSERSVVTWDGERASRQLERLRRVARAAAGQARRCRVPGIEGIVDVAAVVAVPEAVLAEPGGEAVSLAHPTVLIGPEGGWSDQERNGRGTVDLGPTVLRAETAALTVCVILAAQRIFATQRGQTREHSGILHEWTWARGSSR